jgi:hypothetical protein
MAPERNPMLCRCIIGRRELKWHSPAGGAHEI